MTKAYQKAMALYVAACATLGKTPVPYLEDRTDSDKVSSDANDRLVICIRAKNLLPDGKVWKPIYDGSERHYYPAFYPKAKGLGFACVYYSAGSVARASVPALSIGLMNFTKKALRSSCHSMKIYTVL